MKKILILAALLISCNTAFSQTADKLFSELKDNSEVKCVEMNKELIDIFMAQDESAKALKGIEEMKMMTINDEDVIGEMRMMLPKLLKNGYKVMMEESDATEQVSVYTLSKGKTVKELLLILQDANECQVLLFKGDIDPDKLEELMSLAAEDDE